MRYLSGVIRSLSSRLRTVPLLLLTLLQVSMLGLPGLCGELGDARSPIVASTTHDAHEAHGAHHDAPAPQDETHGHEELCTMAGSCASAAVIGVRCPQRVLRAPEAALVAPPVQSLRSVPRSIEPPPPRA